MRYTVEYVHTHIVHTYIRTGMRDAVSVSVSLPYIHTSAASAVVVAALRYTTPGKWFPQSGYPCSSRLRGGSEGSAWLPDVPFRWSCVRGCVKRSGDDAFQVGAEYCRGEAGACQEEWSGVEECTSVVRAEDGMGGRGSAGREGREGKGVIIRGEGGPFCTQGDKSLA